MAHTFKHQRLYDEKAWYKKHWKMLDLLRLEVDRRWNIFNWVFPKDITEPPDIKYHKRVSGKKFWRTYHWRRHRHDWKQVLKKQNWVRFELLPRKPHDFMWDIT